MDVLHFIESESGIYLHETGVDKGDLHSEMTYKETKENASLSLRVCINNANNSFFILFRTPYNT